MHLSTLTAWLGTYLVHSTALLGLAWLATRGLASARAREVLWRAALFGGLVTATVQTVGETRPALGRFGMGALRTAQAPSAQLAPQSEALADAALSAAVAARPVPLQRDLRGVGAVALGLGAVFGTLSLAAGVATLARRRRQQVRITSGAAAELFHAQTAVSRRLRRAELWRCPAAESPYATGVLRPRVVVPARAFSELDSAELTALFAHELAHIARRDPLWLGLTRALQLCLPLQPLNALARRRLCDCAELLCDERAVAVTGDRLALAQSLAKVAGWLVREDRLPDAACAMASRRSLLGVRVERILDDEAATPRLGAGAARAAALVGLAGTALAAPAVHLERAAVRSAELGASSALGAPAPAQRLAADLAAAVALLEQELHALQLARGARDLGPALAARIEWTERRVLEASARAKRIGALLERAAPVGAGTRPASIESSDLEEPK